MNHFNRAAFTLHRITGTFIAIFFCIWFLTGLVLLYHNFPRLDRNRAISISDPLPATLAFTDSLPSGLRSLDITSSGSETIIRWSGTDTSAVCTPSGNPLPPVTFADAYATASRWLDAPIARVDTLTERDQWIMYSRYLDELPIYKFFYDDSDGSELYVASRSAEPLQFTTRESRFWAWIGAIPHKLYFPALRADVDSWKTWLHTGATICLIASVTGLYVALLLWIKTRRRTRRWRNPMKGKLLRFHFTLGLIFALPLISWSVSGLFTIQKVPSWLVPVEGPEYISSSKLWGRGMLAAEEYRLDYATVLRAFPEARAVSYGRVGKIPVITVTTPETDTILDASSPTIRPLSIPRGTVENSVRRLFGDSIPMTIETIHEPDNLYFGILYDPVLPVYRVRLETPGSPVLYINPSNGDVTYYNDNRRAKKLLFSGLHYLNLRIFAGHPTAWYVTIWILCLTGIVFCFTSAQLGWRYIKRKLS
ncbi:MAG: PepSY domain-containing protein [Paramuribaculum sp.]|nr:PepSY domain-containing protein [Paramuribaculum sp.]